MYIGDTLLEDTFAEAFRMRYARLIITAHDDYWLDAALREFTGYSTSVISCDSETGVAARLGPDQTPDGRPGAVVLAFGFSADGLAKAIPNRAGQCLMTCPTTALFDGLPGTGRKRADPDATYEIQEGERIPLGKHIRFFGDGFQRSKRFSGRRYWRIPVMDGEFLVEDSLGVTKGVGGGNIIIQANSTEAALSAVRRATEAIAPLPEVITPFPGGVARSGSKVGSIYKGLPASTADAFCPTLRGRVETKLHEGVHCAYEIVIDGVDEAAVAQAMATAIRSAAGEGVLAIAAGNYGGKLGKFHFRLHELIAES